MKYALFLYFKIYERISCFVVVWYQSILPDRNDVETNTNQITTKLCAYFLGYNVQYDSYKVGSVLHHA